MDDPEEPKGILKPASAEEFDGPASSGVSLSFADLEGFSFSLSFPFPISPLLMLRPCPRIPPGFVPTFPASPPEAPEFMRARFDVATPRFDAAAVE